ncbi:MAG: hypothetical protein CMJ18_03960 [Phycisphaeraceae bacterium]|nr:hypothetical protein [Phycisphaeraceae bacterium]
MTVSLAVVLIAASAAAPVEIESDIGGRDYHWKVTNRSKTAITSIRVPVHQVYNEKVPKGWQFRKLSADMFEATADSAVHSIYRDGTAKFTVRAASSGAVLSLGKAYIGFRDGSTVEVANVWTPRPEPKSTVIVVPCVIAALALLHTTLTRRN